MITNISDRKDTKFLSYNNTLSVEIKFHWQIIAFFLLYRWHSFINSVSLFTFPAKYADIASESAIFECFRKHYHDFICQINAIYFIPPSQMTRKSNRTWFEEIFAEEDEYRLFQ